jgi:hypothetical protein
VFLNTDPSDILGLSKSEIIKQESEDLVLFEFRHFLRRLRKTNTQMLELLFAEDFDFSLMEKEFEIIRAHKYSLIDSEMLFKSLMGYIQNERIQANGERSGKLGGKKKKNLDQYGFSPKNFSHLLRLAHCGTTFFKTDEYPVNIARSNPEFREFLYSVKTEPWKHNRERLNILSDQAEEELIESFEFRKSSFSFNELLANHFCLEFYLPFLVT